MNDPLNDRDRLFPELELGASLGWFAFQFADGSISQDPARAIAARRAGQVVRLWPKTLGAAYTLRAVRREALAKPRLPVR
jgi:hypothetical protein